MDMIVEASHSITFAIRIAYDRRQIGKEIWTDRLFEQGNAILRAENYVDEWER